MFDRLKEQWQHVKQATPGTRFQKRYEQLKNRRCSPLVKPFYMLVGMTLFLFGVLLMFAPGPGFLVIFLGAGMLAEESLLAARALDRAEVALRRLIRWALRIWARASAAVKTLIALVAAALAAGAGVIGYTLFFA